MAAIGNAVYSTPDGFVKLYPDSTPLLRGVIMKRLVLLCDGTWLGADGARTSNVVHLARVILPRSSEGIEQITFYHPGLGEDIGLQAASAETLGQGIDRDILCLYRFLVLNYSKGDELFLFGFSRGAYIVRSLVGMLRNAWLLRREHAALIAHAYHIYRTKWHADADNALRFREPHAREVRVRFLGVWDTVGALGIPLDLFKGFDADRYNFHDTTISRIVDHACHALAIDERRKPFAPTLWNTRSDRSRTEQAWFSGSHRDIGGGYHEAGLSHLSLRWMVEQAQQSGLAVDHEQIERITAQHDEAVVHSGISLTMRLLGTADRCIGTSNADETLHSSAEQRYLHDKRYRPRNLVRYLERDEQIRLPL